MNLNKALKQIKHLDRFDTLHAMSSGSSGQLTSCQGASKDYFWSSNLNWVEVFAAWHHWAGLGPVLGGGAASPGIYFTDEVLSSTAQSLTTNNNSPRRGQQASYWSRAGLPRCDWSSRRTSARRRHFRPGRWEARADAALPQWQPGHRPRGSHFYTHTRNTMTR